jgi:hypothetical protein
MLWLVKELNPTTIMIGSIDIKTRPLKLAFLVDSNSGKQVREAIRLASTLWGGSYFPIIPLHKRMPATWRDNPLKTPPAKRVILGYIEAFDPDVLVQFSTDLPQYINETGLRVITPEEVWERLDDGRSFSPKFGLGIFEILREVFDENFKFKAKYPVSVMLPRIPSRLSLFWASVFGELPERHREIVERHYADALEIQSVDVKNDNLVELLAPKTRFPRRLVQHGIATHNRSYRLHTGFVFFLDATKIEDIVDFWNLRALGKPVIAVPKQLTNNPQLNEHVIGFVKEHRRHWPHNPKVCDRASFIRARNCSMEDMQAYATSLKIERDPNDPSSDGFILLQHWYPRVWDEWARDKDGAAPDDLDGEKSESVDIGDTNELQFRIPSVLPSFAQPHGYHGEPRCANEISFRFYGKREYLAEVFPKAAGKRFLRAISELGSVGEWRAGRNGLVKLVKYEFTSTRSIPTAEEVFFAWLSDFGWRPKLSPPGMLARQLYRKAGGYPGTLADEKMLGLLEHMNGGTVRRDGSPTDENVVNQERDLEVGEVKSRLRRDLLKGRLHDSLVSMGAFKIGLRVRCTECQRQSWFPLESVRDTFTCPKCLTTFPAIGNLGDSKWCYKTAGPFSVPRYAEGAYAVLLSLQLFGDHKLRIGVTPVMSFAAEAPDKKELEADFALFWQQTIFGEETNGLLFGECKSYGQFEKKDYDRMRYLAKMFPGAVLVFSTLRKTLSPTEIVEIGKITKAGRKYWKAERPLNAVLILTGTELFGDFAPPYCWDDATKKRFEHVHGLFDLCDATQQVYLNLPSWRTEWHEQFERRRARAMAKAQAGPSAEP